MSARDDFTPSVKRMLAQRAGYHCSNPACRRFQVGPSSGSSDKAVNLGKAAHIRAAAPGGPRYDSEQSSEHRSSIENGIYLCGGCADLVDKNNGEGYPTEKLGEWKETHEEWIRERLNRGELDDQSFDSVIWQEKSISPGGVGQAQSVHIINNGITYSDAKEIALDVYKNNVPKLSEHAGKIALERAEKLTERFLQGLTSPEKGFEALRSPGLQHSLLVAQREYARTGDSDLESLLVDMLSKRAGELKRTLRQISLDEAISVIGKLTVEHMDALTIHLVLNPTVAAEHFSTMSLSSLLNDYLSRLGKSLAAIESRGENQSCYQHIASIGCGTLIPFANLKVDFRECIANSFTHHFVNCIEPNVLVSRYEDFEWAFIECVEIPGKIKLNIANDLEFWRQCEIRGIDQERGERFLMWTKNLRMTKVEIHESIVSACPDAKLLIRSWNTTGLGRLQLSPVGEAIAQANLRQRFGIHD